MFLNIFIIFRGLSEFRQLARVHCTFVISECPVGESLIGEIQEPLFRHYFRSLLYHIFDISVSLFQYNFIYYQNKSNRKQVCFSYIIQFLFPHVDKLVCMLIRTAKEPSTHDYKKQREALYVYTKDLLLFIWLIFSPLYQISKHLSKRHLFHFGGKLIGIQWSFYF